MTSNEELVQLYLNHYGHSKGSQKMRKSSLNYLFGKQYFNYQGSILKIEKGTILDYFNFLKDLNNISIKTRRNKWMIFKSFLNYLMYRFDDFVIKMPPPNLVDFKKAKPLINKTKSKRIKITQKEVIEQVLQYFKVRHFKHYLFFRLIALGARKGEIINLKCDEVNTTERYINPREGKTGEKYYFYDIQLAEYLDTYLIERHELDAELDYLFLTNRLHRYNEKTFNDILKKACEQIGLEGYMTIQTFRATINNLRKEMNCPLEDRKLLLGHALNDVNVQSYTDHSIKNHRAIADRWDPYKDLNM